MPSTNRAQLLRQRFKALFPSKRQPIIPKSPRKIEEPKKRGFQKRWMEYSPIDLSALGRKDPKARWVYEPAKVKPKPVVAPNKERHGTHPLTSISAKLQPGSPLLAKRQW